MASRIYFFYHFGEKKGLPRWRTGKEYTCQHRRRKRLRFESFGREDLLDEEIVTHSNILVWKVP